MSAATTSKIFIGSIPHTVTEEDLRREVGQHGRITDLFYMQDQVQQCRGWAFVTFASRDDAIKAINAIDAKLIFPGGERTVEARFANQKPSSLNSFNSKVPPKPPQHVWQQFKTPEGHVYYYNTITCQTQWECPRDFDAVIAPPGGAVGHAGGGGGRFPGAAAAGPGGAGANSARPSSFGPPGSNLFLFHVPSDWNDIDLVQHFQHFGSILSARIQRDESGRNRGFGFISFDNPQSSTNAIRGMNGFCVNGKYLKVQHKKGEEHAAAAFQPPQNGAAMPGPAAPFLGIHSHNSQSIRYAPY